MSRDDHAVQLIEPWWPKRRQNIITALTTLPQRWVSTRKHQYMTAITTMWTESSWAFPESYTADESWIVRSSDGGNGETKGLITTQPRWVSAQLLYVCVIAWWRSQGCSQNLCSPFLRAGRFHYIILDYIILYYAAQFYIILRGTIFPLPGVYIYICMFHRM